MPPGVSGPQGCAGLYPQRVEMETEIRDPDAVRAPVEPDQPGGGGDGGDADGPPASLASKAASRVRSTSFSSRASRAISLTASNSSRLTKSRSRNHFSAWVLNKVSTSRLMPCATSAASCIRRATSSKKRLLVWVMCRLQRPLLLPSRMGTPAKEGKPWL